MLGRKTQNGTLRNGYGTALVAMALAACGPAEETNGATNNSSNDDQNVSSNNEEPINNGANSSNGATNNDATNNANTTNNGSNNTSNGSNNNTNNNVVRDCLLHETDEGGDGTVDTIVLVEPSDDPTRYKTFHDTDADGEWDIIVYVETDDEGRDWKRQIDYGADGDLYMELITEYDEGGRETAHYWDIGLDGTLEYERRATYDENGQLLEFTRDGKRTVLGSLAYEADGTVDYRRVRTWAGPDQPLEDKHDVDGDGTFDVTVSAVVGPDGLPTELQYDGAVTRGQFRWRNGNPKPERDLIEAADGEVDVRIFDMIYDDEGRVISQRVDGRLAVRGGISLRATEADPMTVTTTYDADGRPITIERDVDEDGVADHVQTITYDAEGNQIRREVDGRLNDDNLLVAAADGEINDVWTREDDGQSRRIERDVDNDGSPELIIETEWNAAGKTTLHRYDGDPDMVWETTSPADGVWDYEQIVEFDEDGYPVGYTRRVRGVVTLQRTTVVGACEELR